MPCTLMTSHPTSNDSKQSGIGWSQHRLQAQRSRCPCNTRWCAVSWRTLASGTAHDSELQFERLHNVVLIPAVQNSPDSPCSKPTLLCAWFIHSSSHALRNCHKLSLNLKERGWLCHLDSFGYIWMLGFKKNGQTVIHQRICVRLKTDTGKALPEASRKDFALLWKCLAGNLGQISQEPSMERRLGFWWDFR